MRKYLTLNVQLTASVNDSVTSLDAVNAFVNWLKYSLVQGQPLSRDDRIDLIFEKLGQIKLEDLTFYPWPEASLPPKPEDLTGV
jgi:hypothetical protein